MTSKIHTTYNVIGENQDFQEDIDLRYISHISSKIQETYDANRTYKGMVWGSNGYGQLGNNTNQVYSSPIQFGNSDWKKLIGVQNINNIGLKYDGTLWGCGLYYLLINNTVIHYSSPIQIGSNSDWKDFDAYQGTMVAIKSDGTLWGWGDNYYYVSGTNIGYLSSPVQINSSNDWSVVRIASKAGYGIKKDGTLWAWGTNNYGQIGNNSNDTYFSSPVQVGSGTNWKDIQPSFDAIIATKTDGTLWAWGANDYGQLGNGTVAYYSSPIQIGNDTDWIINNNGSMNNYHYIALKTDGSMWAWGYNNIGQLGNGTVVNYSSPIRIGSSYNWMEVCSHNIGSMGIKKDGTLWAWGTNEWGYLGIDDNSLVNSSSPIQVGNNSDWVKLGKVKCALRNNVPSTSGISVCTDEIKNKLFVWGSNAYGKLGLNVATGVYYSTPVQLGVNEWKSVSSGDIHALAIKTDGSMWAWGHNTDGELGDGTTVSKSSPVRIGLDKDWNYVFASSYYASFAIKKNGTLWAWGDNSYNVLGDGTSVFKSTPVKIGSATNWKQVISSTSFAIGIRTDGTLWAWGQNSQGEFGNGTTNSASTPIQIGNGTNWNYILGVGGDSTHVLKTDGTLWGWGVNTYGQVGDGTNINKSTPVQIGGSTWKPASSYHLRNYSTSIAIKSDGTLWGWGDNYNGDLSLNPLGVYYPKNVSYSSPVQIGTISRWKSVHIIHNAVLGINNDGTLWGWGDNSTYSLGNGTLVSYSSPVQIGNLNNWLNLTPRFGISQ